MAEDKCYSACRYMLMFFTGVFFLLGIALLGLGIYARVHSTKYDDYLAVIDQSNSTWENFGSLSIASGVICMLMGFTGLVGVLKDHRGCLIVFLVIIIIVFILELVGGGLAIGFQDKIKDRARDGMYRTIVSYDNTSNSDVTKGWDEVQQDSSCCGVRNYTDWETNPRYSEGTYPDSCRCSNENGCSATVAHGDVFPNGCYDSVIDKVQGSWKTWGGVLIGFGIFQLIGIISAIVVIKNHGKSRYYLA